MIKLDTFESFKDLDQSTRLCFVRWDLIGIGSYGLSFKNKRDDIRLGEISLTQFKYFRAFGLNCFLTNEEIRIEIVFGSVPTINLYKEDIPDYVLEDSVLLTGVVDEIVADLLSQTESSSSIKSLFPNNINSPVFLKDFPKSIKKEYLYNYLPVPDVNSELFLNKSGKAFEYSWDPFDIYVKITIWGNTYLLHRFRLESGYHRFWVYNYNGVIVNEKDMKSINQLISYKVWEM